MIRLVALRDVMQNVSAEQATMLSCGNSSYINLMKCLPSVLPYPTWYALVQAQLLSGIKPREINSRLDEPLNHTCLHRIRKYPEPPRAIYCLNEEKSLEYLIPTAKQFYYGILKLCSFRIILMLKMNTCYGSGYVGCVEKHHLD